MLYRIGVPDLKGSASMAHRLFKVCSFHQYHAHHGFGLWMISNVHIDDNMGKVDPETVQTWRQLAIARVPALRMLDGASVRLPHTSPLLFTIDT